MAVTKRTGNQFAAEMRAWTLEMKDYTKLVWQESVLDLIETMQLPRERGGRMPVRSGFLRASLVASTTMVPVASLVNPNPDGFFPWDVSRVEGVIRGMRVGQMVNIGYTAAYADVVEFGGGGQPAAGFQRLAVMEWPYIVESVISRLNPP